MKFTQDVIAIKESINENILLVQVILNNMPQDATWQTEIFFEGKVVKRWAYSREVVFAFNMEMSGTYGVKVTAKDTTEQYHPLRKAVKYYTPEMISGYKKFLCSDMPNPNCSSPIPLYCPSEPFQNIGIIFTQNVEQTTRLDEHEGEIRSVFNDMNCSLLWDKGGCKVVALSQKLPFQNNIIFSGRTKYEKRIVLGQDDLGSGINYDILLDEIGLWTAVKYDQQQIVFTNDYFGMYKMYYYSTNGLAVVTNNYHMLLLILKSMDVKMTLNLNNTLPYFLKAEGGFLEQRFFNEMDVENITALPIDKYVVIDQSGLRIKEKSISETLNSEDEYNEHSYLEMMKNAAEEIKENVEIALADERFENVVFDLTGGKDSRTVLAALLAVDGKEGKYRDKVRINTVDISNDKDTAIGINNIFNFKYDDLERKYNAVRLADKEIKNRSFFMGATYSRPFPGEKIISTETNARILNITGAGESNLRPYYTITGFGIPTSFFDFTDVEKIIGFYLNTVYETWNVCVSNKKCKDILFDKLKYSAISLPGNTLKEKFDMFLQFYRNVYHFGVQTIITSVEASMQWQPLYSKKAFKAFRMIFNKHCDIKFQLDLIAHMCPMLAVLPFESSADNENVKRFIDELYLDDMYKNMKINIDTTSKTWDESQKLKKQRAVTVNKDETEHISKDNDEYRKNFYNNLFDMLKVLLTAMDGAYEFIGLELYAYFTREKERFEGKGIPRSTQFMFNKIASIIDEMAIIGGN